MFFPLRTDRQLKHTPWMNGAIIAVNAIVFLFVQQGNYNPALQPYELNPLDPQLHQFITYQFLHANWQHIGFNMLFLYVFGNSVEDRMGKVGYLAFFLAGGVLAGLGHMLLEPVPVIGASGAVCAVTGAYLLLFPLSNVTMVFWFFIIGTFEVSSVFLIGFQIAQNVLFHAMGMAGVAYLAHLAGYAFGISIAAAMLGTRLLPREPYDMLTLIAQRRRRSKFRAMTRQGYRPWEHETSLGRAASKAGSGTRSAEADAQTQQIMQLRTRISQAIANHDLPQAAGDYRGLLQSAPDQVFGQSQQLDLANQLMSEGDYAASAQAYELMLKHYPGYAQREQVQLILGLIYTRYLKQPDRAIEVLEQALPRLSDDSQKTLANQLLQENR